MNWNFVIFYDSISSGASLSAKTEKNMWLLRTAQEFFLHKGTLKFICKGAFMIKKSFPRTYSFLLKPPNQGKSLRCEVATSIARSIPPPISAKGRLQFGGREVFTFPPLCPLPLTKGGAFFLRQAEGKGVKRSDSRERSSQSSTKQKGLPRRTTQILVDTI